MRASKFSDALKAFILKAGCRRRSGGRDLPQSRHQSGDVFQLEEEV